jgi:hypothetical protein
MAAQTIKIHTDNLDECTARLGALRDNLQMLDKLQTIHASPLTISRGNYAAAFVSVDDDLKAIIDEVYKLVDTTAYLFNNTSKYFVGADRL